VRASLFAHVTPSAPCTRPVRYSRVEGEEERRRGGEEEGRRGGEEEGRRGGEEGEEE
jgi:hypothetical protein